MQKFGKTLITNSGRKMLVEVDGAKGQLTYTRAALFKQDIKGLAEEDQIALSELSGQQIETPLEVTQIQDTTITVSASFNNSKVSQDLPFNTIGWFAKTSVDNTEQLMAVTPSLAEQTLVAGVEGASTSALDIDMVVGRSHNTTVVLSPNQAGVVSSKQLEAVVERTKIELAASTDEKLKSKVDKSEIYPRDKIDEMLSQAGKLKKISVNGGSPVEPDAAGVANIDIKEPDLSGFETKEDAQRQLAKKVESVNGRLPDNLGAIRLPSFSNADFVINKSDFDLDTATNPGYYRFVSANLSTGVNNTNGLTDLPNFTNVSGYLIVINYSDYYVIQLLMLLDTADVKDITFAFRTIGKNNYKYRDKFKRLITSNELRDLQNQYAELRDREIVHSCDDLATGTAYSKAHPNVIVGTP